MTLAENVGLPLGEYTDLRPDEIREIALLKLALVGLKGRRLLPIRDQRRHAETGQLGSGHGA
jgi:ABC-type transporter Mla maintaining outer membrane lipid asymmetry ATPase subunit MlaF